MRHQYGILRWFNFIVLACAASAAQMTPSFTIENKSTSKTVEIIALDNAHRKTIPASLDIRIVPAGSFLLKARRDKAITVIHAIWTYTDESGKSRQHNVTCDGYYFGPVQVVAKSNNLVLVTPDGCASEENFSRLASTGVLDELQVRFTGLKSDPAKQPAVISVLVDSVIFEDGQIWGPDKHRYYLSVMNRNSVLESLAVELTQAKDSGEGIASRVEKIRNEKPVMRDQRSSLRYEYAGLFQRSPNPEGTLKALKARAPLPEFHHMGEADQ